MQTIHRFLSKQVKKGQKTPEHSETPSRWFTLPREIRDEIYHEVLCRTYLIHWPARWRRGKAVFNDNRTLFEFRGGLCSWTGIFWSGHVWMVKRPLFWANIALLLTAKAICQEAMEIMYKGSSFSVYLGQRTIRWYRMTPLPSQHLLSRIQNLEMDTCVCDTQDYTASETWFEKFNGSDIKRNSCRISFPCYCCLVWCTDHTPFFRACRSLVGFKTVTISLELEYTRPDEELFERYNSMREDFQAALEPHLGPGRSYYIDHCFCLEFHPRKHLEDLQAALPQSGVQALGP